ncbi:MAG: hypothetical protein HGA75_02625 [Thiobacillus sp.]|nr:hypothetical protein [Thiobacillus sp.]
MRRKIRGWLCGLGLHDLQFVGVDRKDRIYRCSCGYRKVEPYTLSVDRIGWKQLQEPKRSLKSLWPSGSRYKRGDAERR